MISALSKGFRILWAIWGTLAFGLVLAVFIPFYMIILGITGNKFVPFLIWISHYIVAGLGLFFMGILVVSKGRENFPKKRGMVIVSNHLSNLDVLVNAVSCPEIFKFLSKKEMGKVPLLGYAARKFAILIDRSDKSSKSAGFRRMEESLAEGISVFIYPEGTRNRSDELLQPFYDGAFVLAIQMKAPIMVATLSGTGKLSDPRKGFNLCPGKVICNWDEPIETHDLTLDDLKDLKEKVRKMMIDRMMEEGEMAQ